MLDNANSGVKFITSQQSCHSSKQNLETCGISSRAGLGLGLKVPKQDSVNGRGNGRFPDSHFPGQTFPGKFV